MTEAPSLHVVEGTAGDATSWAGFALPGDGAWTLLVAGVEGGETGFDRPAAHALLTTLTGGGALVRPDSAEAQSLDALGGVEVVRALSRWASPAAVVALAASTELEAALAGVRRHRSAAKTAALERRYGKDAPIGSPPPLHDWLGYQQPPSVEDLRLLLAASAGVQIWRFGGHEWGLHAIAPGPRERWIPSLTDVVSTVTVHASSAAVPVW